MAWWGWQCSGHGWGHGRKRGRQGEASGEEQPSPSPIELAVYYPPPPLLWAVPPFPGPWGRPSPEVELELLRAQRHWLETVKKMIEEQIREVDKRIRGLEEEVKG